jgi:hypothetical protein
MAEFTQSIKIQLDDQASKGMKAMQRQAQGLKGKLDNLGKGFNNVGKASRDLGKGLALSLSAPIVGVGAFMVKSASDAEETAQKFSVVFKQVSKESEEVAKNLAKNYGLSGQESKALLSATGDLLTGFGMQGDQALDLSEKVQKLAVDLASFTNLEGGAERASQALTSGLLGEREAMKSLGIVVNEEMVKNMVQAMTIAGKFTNETEQQKKAIATLEIAYQQSGNAIGDFERSQGSLANQQRIMMAQLKDLADSFGKILIPAMLKVIETVKPYIAQFMALDETTKRNILIIAGLVAGLAPLLYIFGQLSIAVGALIPIFTSIAGVIGTVTGAFAGFIGLPILAVIGAIALGATAIVHNWEKVKAFFTALGEFFEATFLFIDEFLQGFLGFSPLEKIQESWMPVKEFFKNLFEDIKKIFNGVMDWIGSRIEKTTKMIQGVTGKIKSVTGGAKAIGEKARGLFDRFNPFGDDEPEESQAPISENRFASQANVNNNENKVEVNLRVDKNGNPVLDSAKSSNGIDNLNVNTGSMIPVM